jgi:hypothetical protein
MRCVGVDTAGGVRMVKGKSSRKIDAAIALAMALVSVVEAGPKIFNPRAVPTGPGGDIGVDLQKELGANFSQRSPFDDGLPEDDDRPGRWGGYGVTRFFSD